MTIHVWDKKEIAKCCHMAIKCQNKKVLLILHSISGSKIKRLRDREWNKKLAWANIRLALGASQT